jgi:hypothetical protein
VKRITPDSDPPAPGHYYWILRDDQDGWELAEIDASGDIFAPPGEGMCLVTPGTYIVHPLVPPPLDVASARDSLPVVPLPEEPLTVMSVRHRGRARPVVVKE